MKRSGWDEPTEVLPRRKRWGHGGVNVFSFGHIIVIGPTTHVFDDVEWGSDAAICGGGSFARLCDVHLKPFGGAAPMAV
jgi:hypothetical protein